MNTNKSYHGSSFDSFLKDEKIFQEVKVMAVEKYHNAVDEKKRKESMGNGKKNNVVKFPSKGNGYSDILEA